MDPRIKVRIGLVILFSGLTFSSVLLGHYWMSIFFGFLTCCVIDGM